MKTTTTIMIREQERNWLERLKRKHRIRNLAEVVQRLKILINKHKMEDEL